VTEVRPDIVDELRAAGCVFAEEEASLLVADAESEAQLRAMVERRTCGEPLEHVLGWAELAGRRIVVEPGVFVPRRRSELLIREAIAVVPERRGVVVDLCCGSGAFGAVIAAACSAVEVHATDVDPVAVGCARRNLPPAAVHQGDLFSALPAELRGRVDVVVANVPYVPTAAVALLPAEARRHEPRVALDGGADGLDVLRRAAADAGGWLVPGGHLLSEISDDQEPSAVAALAAEGLEVRVARDDDLDAVVVLGRRG
jgi:release factor glutamine methyltransferase